MYYEQITIDAIDALAPVLDDYRWTYDQETEQLVIWTNEFYPELHRAIVVAAGLHDEGHAITPISGKRADRNAKVQTIRDTLKDAAAHVGAAAAAQQEHHAAALELAVELTEGQQESLAQVFEAALKMPREEILAKLEAVADAAQAVVDVLPLPDSFTLPDDFMVPGVDKK